jgi:Flp pilus assembly protein CpaB
VELVTMSIVLVAILAAVILACGLAMLLAVALGRAAARGDADIERHAGELERELRELPEIAVSRRRPRVGISPELGVWRER